MSNLQMLNLPAQQVAATPSATPQPRLVKAAHEFEAAMMKELLAPLAPGHDALGGDNDEIGSNSALGSFAGEALGKALSEHGGFGIAKSILHQLTPKSNHSGNASVPGNRTPSNSKFTPLMTIVISKIDDKPVREKHP